MSTIRKPLSIQPQDGADPPRTAMVMAAGLGKRMRPLTATRPKPLVEVAGRTLLDHCIDRLKAGGVEKAVVNVHYLADAVEAHLRTRVSGIDIAVSDGAVNTPALISPPPVTDRLTPVPIGMYAVSTTLALIAIFAPASAKALAGTT